MTYRPFSRRVQADPYPYYRELRAHAPVYHLPEEQLWVLTRYDDVVAALRDPQVFSSQRGMSDMMLGRSTRTGEQVPEFLADMIGRRLLIAADPPDHGVLRRLTAKVFTPRAIAQLEPRIRRITGELVDHLIDAGDDGDLVEHLANPLPVIVIAELLGIPTGRREDFKRWSDSLVGALSGSLAMEAMQADSTEMFTFFSDAVRERGQSPGEDLISLLVTRGNDDGAALGPVEIILFCILLLIAGNETTTNLIGNGARALWDHPEQARRLAADPSRIPAAVEETLRYDSPVQSLFRGTTTDATLPSGGQIPAGARVMVCFGSANRDEAHFPAAEEYIIDRDPKDHVAFGSGIHFCLGAPLARLETRVAAETLLSRLRSLEPAGEPERVDSFILRGYSSLPAHAKSR
ncbi:MAG TPA: cytochrome P450 [Mycobacteriales bacterium]|jgi:cytochrome P450|nr:cytochrome P450 [Mycobacteriales bacterium]HWC36399.1 cytochrome P450 [Mycobacteriales bacterium]